MTNRTFSRALTLLSLLTWSGVLLGFYFSGRMNQYLIGAYRPLTALAGFLLLALAGVLLATWRVSGSSPILTVEDDLAVAGGSGSGRSRRVVQVLGFLVLTLPVATAVGVSSDSFGANTVRRRGLVTDIANLPTKANAAAANAANPASVSKTAPAPVMPELPLPGDTPTAENSAPLTDAASYLPTSPDGHLLVSVVDLLMAAEDDTLRPQFEGRTVELVGQFMPDTKNNAGGNRFNLVRMFMVCCAADARPVALSIEASQPPKLAEMAWTKVVGTIAFPVQDGRRLATVRSGNVSLTDPPAELMLY